VDALSLDGALGDRVPPNQGGAIGVDPHAARRVGDGVALDDRLTPVRCRDPTTIALEPGPAHRIAPDGDQSPRHAPIAGDAVRTGLLHSVALDRRRSTIGVDARPGPALCALAHRVADDRRLDRVRFDADVLRARDMVPADGDRAAVTHDAPRTGNVNGVATQQRRDDSGG